MLIVRSLLGGMAFLINPIIINWAEFFHTRTTIFLSPVVLKTSPKKSALYIVLVSIKADELIVLCVCLSQEAANASLTTLSISLQASTAVLMSQEGVKQRFNSTAVVFLRDVLMIINVLEEVILRGGKLNWRRFTEWSNF